MVELPERFNAFRVHNDDQGYRSGVESLTPDDLGEGDLTVQVNWSGINYKDALAATGKGKIIRKFPLTGGIDLSGTVVASDAEQFQPGDQVIVTGCGLSETSDGGFSEYQRVNSADAVPMPTGLDPRQAMILGTAGFTAALSLLRMEANGQTPDAGPIVVTGASGGVGSIAINLLTHLGYEVHAITGKIEAFDWLEKLGASQCISRQDLHWGQNALEKAIWAGCIDSVGGDMLDGISRSIRFWGNIACCGMAGGHGLHTNVFPMIIRGVSLLGVTSSNCPYPTRRLLWDRLANEWKPPLLEEIMSRQVALDEMMPVFESMLAGEAMGRTVVRISGH